MYMEMQAYILDKNMFIRLIHKLFKKYYKDTVIKTEWYRVRMDR